MTTRAVLANLGVTLDDLTEEAQARLEPTLERPVYVADPTSRTRPVRTIHRITGWQIDGGKLAITSSPQGETITPDHERKQDT